MIPLARGALVGAAAGCLLALADALAVAPWWLPPGDATLLVLRLTTTAAAVGATVGALAMGLRAPLHEAVRRLVARGAEPALAARRHRRWWPLPWVLLAMGPLAWVAHLSFMGGAAARLPAQGALRVVATAVLATGLYFTLRAAHGVVCWARGASATHARMAGAGLLALALGLAEVDRRAYPMLYEHLHASATAAAFGVAALGWTLWGIHGRRLRTWGHGSVRGLAVLGALWGALVLQWSFAGSAQSVRVAMFDPRAATSRTVMHALGALRPASHGPDAGDVALARARRIQRARQAAAIDGLPGSPGTHVLLVTVDALRADHVGLYGYDREITPHMDTLAEASVVFERAYAPAPHSSYALCSLMVSEYLHETVEMGVPPPDETLASVLGTHGYYTAGLYTQGIFHTAGEELAAYRKTSLGFDVHVASNMDAEARTDRALAQVDRIVAAGEPSSFLWVHYFDVHEPYREDALGDSAMDRYDGEIRNVDRALGRLLSEVEARLAGDVIVVLTADHGEEFRDHGGLYHGSTLYEEQIRVPLLVRAPGVAPRRVTAPVNIVDLAPTLLALLRLPIPPSMRGQDLRALMTGRIDDVGPAFAGVSHKRMAVQGSHKLITDLRHELVELYDLAQDPAERRNLADMRPDRVAQLRGEIHAWLDALGTPPGVDAGEASPHEMALNRGRLRDRRAVPALVTLLGDRDAPDGSRAEAARLLGRIEDGAAAEALAEAQHADAPEVSMQAAIALGRLGDARARGPLRRWVQRGRGESRRQAALALGGLGDPAALPALEEAARDAASREDRSRAIRLLARLGDARAVDTLVALLEDLRVRRVAIRALGRIGDPRALPPLMDLLAEEHRPHMRDRIAEALARLDAKHATPRMVHMAATEPDLRLVGRALVRLGAPRAGAVGGLGLGPEAPPASAFVDCRGDPRVSWCEVAHGPTRFTLPAPTSVQRAPGAVALLRARRADAEGSTGLRIQLGDHPPQTLKVGAQWQEHRVAMEAPPSAADAMEATLTPTDPEARIQVDHLLLIPRPGGDRPAAPDLPADRSDG